MTPDAICPLAAEHVLVTRHLIAAQPVHFSGFRPVAVLRTGVLGTTGVESAEAVRGLAEQVEPSLIIAVDALASRRMGRVCTAVQLSDSGIIPGSGVGNHRAALNRETLGVRSSPWGCPRWWTPPTWRRTCWRNPVWGTWTRKGCIRAPESLW